MEFNSGFKGLTNTTGLCCLNLKEVETDWAVGRMVPLPPNHSAVTIHIPVGLAVHGDWDV